MLFMAVIRFFLKFLLPTANNGNFMKSTRVMIIIFLIEFVCLLHKFSACNKEVVIALGLTYRFHYRSR